MGGIYSKCCKAILTFFVCSECEEKSNPYDCDLYVHGICGNCKRLNIIGSQHLYMTLRIII